MMMFQLENCGNGQKSDVFSPMPFPLLFTPNRVKKQTNAMQLKTKTNTENLPKVQARESSHSHERARGWRTPDGTDFLSDLRAFDPSSNDANITDSNPAHTPQTPSAHTQFSRPGTGSLSTPSA